MADNSDEISIAEETALLGEDENGNTEEFLLFITTSKTAGSLSANYCLQVIVVLFWGDA